MNFIQCFVILSLVARGCLSLRIQHPLCDGTYYHLYVNEKIGWRGFAFAWTEIDQRLSNITFEVNLATEELPQSSFLGSLKMLHFHKLQTTLKNQRWNLIVEVQYPRQDPLPDVTAVILNGDYICSSEEKEWDSPKPVKIKLYMEYNDYTRTQRYTAKIIPKVVPLAPIPTQPPEPVPDNRVNVDDNIDCGTVDLVNIYEPLIVNGETITRGTWPWLVAVFSYIGPRLGFQCGATLISRKVILTAAHCFFDRYNRKIDLDDILLILGQHSLKRPYDKGTQIVYPETVNIHEHYGKRTAIDSDIAVVVLSEAIHYTTFIRPACLWKESVSKQTIVGVLGTTAGWGRDEAGNFYTELPRKAEFPVVTDEDCLRSNKAFPKLTSGVTFCAGWRNGSDGPCSGDSGGGLLFKRNNKWTIRGVVSTALTDRETGSCDLNEYVIYTDIASFIPWIETFMTGE